MDISVWIYDEFPVKMAYCHSRSPQRIFALGFLSAYNRLANHFRSVFVARLTTQTLSPSETWQTPENTPPSSFFPVLFLFVSPLSPKVFPLSGWAAAGFQTNSPKHVVCESVRPALLLGTKAAIHNVSRWRWHPRENGQRVWASHRRRQS